MNTYRADLHMHTVLSPCAGLDMSPRNIVATAAARQLDIIGITDHNSTYHCALITKIAMEYGILVMMGAEVTTREEVHCLVFFETQGQLTHFQGYLDQHLQIVKNDPELFGYQLIVDENETILRQEDRLLINALDVTLEQLETEVHQHDGLFIPAHVDKSRFSISSQLGFLPSGIPVDAFEVVGINHLAEIFPNASHFGSATLLSGSDAHSLDQLGIRYSEILMEEKSFPALRNALQNSQNTKRCQA